MTQRVTRRLILVAGGASLVALACGDDSESSNGQGGASASSTSSSGQGGSNAGGAGAGGDNVGGGATACGMALVVRGSNYAIDPHELMIPLADLEAGVTKTYTSTVANNHDHDVTLTAEHFTALRNGEAVMLYTCFDNPNSADHEWVISCADPNIMPTFEGEIGTANNCPA